MPLSAFSRANNQKGIAHILVVLILVIGIVAGFILIQDPKIFKPKAGGDMPVCYAGKVKNISYGESCSGGYKSFKYSCTDNFTSEVGKEGNGCFQSDYIQEYAKSSCNTHYSCSDNPTISTIRTLYFITNTKGSIVDPFELKDGEEVDVIFWPTGGSGEGVKVLHTALWEGATSENDAKRGGREGSYQGWDQDQIKNVRILRNPLVRRAKAPFYMEFYTVDRDGNEETVQKITVKERSQAAYVFVNTFEEDFNNSTLSKQLEENRNVIENAHKSNISKQISLSSSGIGYPTLLVDGQFPNYSPYAPELFEFYYLTPGNHKLYFNKIPGYDIAFVICGSNSNNKCYYQYPKKLDPIQVPGGLYYVDFKLRGDEEYAFITINYYPEFSEADNPSTPSPIPQGSLYPEPSEVASPSATPTSNLTSVVGECLISGEGLSISWPYDPSAKSFKLRGAKGISIRPSDSEWSNIPQSDKIIVNDIPTSNCAANTLVCSYSTSKRATDESIKEGDSYFVWVHSVDQNNQTGQAQLAQENIVCK